MRHRSIITLAASLAVLALATSALADRAYYVSEEDAPHSPPEPISPGDPGEGYTWDPAVWTTTGPATSETIIQGPITIGPGKHRRFGFTNEYRSGNIKVFTLKFTHDNVNYPDGYPEVRESESRAGIHPAHGVSDPVRCLLVDTDISDTLFTYTFHFRPQPDWEYITIENGGAAGDLVMWGLYIRTQCIPAPVTAALLPLAGAALGRRRR
jgi:uncharacterized protein (TIGR03382 family)